MLVKFDPFKEIRELEKRIYNSMPVATASDNSISTFTPSVNTREDEKGYYIEVDLPGVKKEDINVDLNDRVLTISGERKFKDEVKEENYYKIETAFGKFERSFSIPEDADVEGIEAKSENGVLEIFIPKVKKETPKKKIEIK
jgi:HSP20 family protein